jgi:hypothetical protein
MRWDEEYDIGEPSLLTTRLAPANGLCGSVTASPSEDIEPDELSIVKLIDIASSPIALR